MFNVQLDPTFLFSPTDCEKLKIKEVSDREMEKKMSGGLKRKREAEDREEEVQRSQSQSADTTASKQKKNLKKAKKGGEKEGVEPAEGGGMKTRRAEKAKETETRRETRLGKKVRKEWGGKEGRCDEEKKETMGREERNGMKRKREEDKRVKTTGWKKGMRAEEKREGNKLQEKGKKPRETPVKDERTSTEEGKRGGKMMEKQREGDGPSVAEEQESVEEEVKLLSLIRLRAATLKAACGRHGNAQRGRPPVDGFIQLVHLVQPEVW